MRRFIACVAFLSGNFVYQYFQIEPDYAFAVTISVYQAFAMFFVASYPTR